MNSHSISLHAHAAMVDAAKHRAVVLREQALDDCWRRIVRWLKPTRRGGVRAAVRSGTCLAPLPGSGTARSG